MIASTIGGRQTFAQTSTCRRPTRDAPKCPFSLPLFVDNERFLLKIGTGNPVHQFHARAEVNRVCQVPTSLLSEQPREELRDVERSHIGKSAARNMFFARHGILLSREQIRHIARKVEMDLESGDMQPQNKMRSLLMKLRDNETQGPVLPSDKIPAAISMDDNLPIVKNCHLPLTKRWMNYTQIHCEEALERYGNTSSPCNHGLS
jgi:hypothetical protein